jgi:type III pantothenate kinase
MLMCIDIGNTNVKLGLFAGEDLRYRWRLATDRNRPADEYAVLIIDLLAGAAISLQEIEACAISSVVPSLTPVFTELASQYLHVQPLVLTPQSATGIEVHTQNPAEVGADLVMNALAGRRLFGAPLIVIGFGTATTFTAVSSAGFIEGVALAPGVAASGEPLSMLVGVPPQAALAEPTVAIGKNSILSLRAGLVYGFAGLVKEIVARMQTELGGSAKVIATGGMAGLIAPHADCIQAVEPDLALIGLRLFAE